MSDWGRPVWAEAIVADESVAHLVRLYEAHCAGVPDHPANLGPSAPFDLVDEVARAHNDWAKHRDALQLLLGRRMGAILAEILREEPSA